MRLVAAPDKFRGTLSAREAARAIAEGAHEVGWDAVELPLADGGEGTLEALGGPNRVTRVTGPLGNPVGAEWRLDGDTAVIEMARASGLLLAGGAERNDPVAATTRGTGELIAAALGAGARTVIVGVGGSATTDGGLGAIEALSGLLPLPSGIELQVACDVQTLFVDAAPVFGPQKGASPEQVALLAQRLRGLVQRYRTELGADIEALPGAGAAGGLAGGLAAAGARLAPGFQLIADLVGLDAALSGAQLVITGEGRLDVTSFVGKVVGGVYQRAESRHLPALAVCGDVAPEARNRLPCVSLVERFGTERAMSDTAACLSTAVADELRSST